MIACLRRIKSIVAIVDEFLLFMGNTMIKFQFSCVRHFSSLAPVIYFPMAIIAHKAIRFLLLLTTLVDCVIPKVIIGK